MPDDTEVGVGFPLAGLDATCEYGRQPADTAAAGANVRSFPPLGERGRGGSRCGLARYIDQLVNGASPVQHLAVLVDPQSPGLRRDTDPTFPDPSTNNLRPRIVPGTRVRFGGSGVPPPGPWAFDGTSPPPPPAPVSLAQAALIPITDRGTSASVTQSLSGPVAPASYLLVAVATEQKESLGNEIGSPAPTVSVSNGSSVAYAEVGSAQLTTPADATSGGRRYRLSLWGLRATGAAADAAVTVTLGPPGPVSCVFLGQFFEFRGVSPLDPTQSFVAATAAGGSYGSITTGSMAVGSVGSLALLVAFVPVMLTVPPVTFGPGVTVLSSPGAAATALQFASGLLADVQAASATVGLTFATPASLPYGVLTTGLVVRK